MRTEHRGRVAQRPAAGVGQAETLPGPPAGHGLGPRQPVADEALVLEPAERRVDGTDRDLAPRPGLDLTPDGVTVGLVVELRQRQQHVDLEFAEEIAFGHRASIFYKRELRRGRVQGG